MPTLKWICPECGEEITEENYSCIAKALEAHFGISHGYEDPGEVAGEVFGLQDNRIKEESVMPATTH